MTDEDIVKDTDRQKQVMVVSYSVSDVANKGKISELLYKLLKF